MNFIVRSSARKFYSVLKDHWLTDRENNYLAYRRIEIAFGRQQEKNERQFNTLAKKSGKSYFCRVKDQW